MGRATAAICIGGPEQPPSALSPCALSCLSLGRRLRKAFAMPQRCSAVGCSNASSKCSSVRFFRFPSAAFHAAKRAKWVVAMRRVNEDGSPWAPTGNSRVCSEHFLTGQPSRFPAHPDYVPSIFKHKKASHASAVSRFQRSQKRQSSKAAARHNCQAPSQSTGDPDTSRPLHGGQDDLTGPLTDGAAENAHVSPSTPLLGNLSPSGESVAQTLLNRGPPADGHVEVTSPSGEESMLEKGCQADDFALQRILQLEALLSAEREKSAKLESELSDARENAKQWQNYYYEIKASQLSVRNMKTTKDMLYYTGLPSLAVFEHILHYVSSRNSPLRENSDKKSHSLEEQLFMVLVRLRTGMATKEICRNFSVSMAVFSRMFAQWILVLQRELTSMTSFPTLAEVQQHIPWHFRRFPNTRIILDTTEVRMQKPSSLVAQKHTFSHYKYANTMKCLVGATPDCYVSFVSAMYGGSTSDRAIVQQSAVLDLLEPGDGVMVDKGFKVDDLLPQGVSLHIPPFRVPGEAQMSARDVEATQNVASARVHIERVIRRIKEFHIFDKPYPINMLDLADAVFTTCALLSNFRGPLINNEREQASEDCE